MWLIPEERFHAGRAHERELGGLVPSATGPKPEPATDQQARHCLTNGKPGVQQSQSLSKKSSFSELLEKL
jgi:hypothetical protein